MAEIDLLEARIQQLEAHIRVLRLARGMLETERTHGCTNGCTGACPDPTGNCTYGCTNGCTNGCTGSCGEPLRLDVEALAKLFPAEAETGAGPAAPAGRRQARSSPRGERKR